MSLLRSILRLGSTPRVSRDARWAAVWIAALAVIEAAGRALRHGAVDALLVVALAALVLVTRALHRRRPITWWAALTAPFGELTAWRERVWGTTGIDLRAGGDVPRGLPVTRVRTLLAVGVLLAAALAAAPWLPGGLRAAGLVTSYALYVAVLAGLVTASLFVWFGLGLFATGVVADARIRALDNRNVPRAGPSPGPRLMAATLVVTLGLALSPLPAAVPAAGMAGCLAAFVLTAMLPRFRRAPVIWRNASHGPRRSSIGAHVLLETALVTLAALLLVTLTTGLGLTVAEPSRPPSATVGAAAAWSALFGLAAIAWRLAALAGSAQRHDPAAPPPRTVRLEGAAPPEVRQALEGAGWRVRGPDDAPGAGEVAADPGAHDLASAAGLAWLARRHEIVQRRLIRRGLQRLLRAAARFRYDMGSGFWIAPHMWLVPALARDQEERQSLEKGTGAIDQVLGPDFVHALPTSARAHAREVLAGADVDLIYLEDGVRWEGLRRVLQVLFEVHDIHGGRRRVLDRDFAGLVGLRVVLHDFDIENPYRAEGYPEPDYEDVARARVLHVFRDRGGEEEDVSSPAPGELVPLFA